VQSHALAGPRKPAEDDDAHAAMLSSGGADRQVRGCGGAIGRGGLG